MVKIARTRVGNQDTVPEKATDSDTMPVEFLAKTTQDSSQVPEESITNSPSQTAENVPVSPWNDMPAANSSVEEEDIPSVSEVFGTKPTN